MLDKIAEAFDRNRNWIINEAIKNYLDLHQWQINQVEQGFADAAAGRTISHDDLKGRIAKRHAKRTRTK